MDKNLRKLLGIPSKENVDYSKIYKFDGEVFENHQSGSVFNIYEYNRGSMDSDRIKLHVCEIAKALTEDGGCISMPPITVDINTLIIIDGNCRYTAFLNCVHKGVKNMFIRVVFEDVPEDEIDDRVIKLNTTQQSWTTINFINNFAERNKGSFRKFREYCMSHSLLATKGGKFNPRPAIASLGISSKELKNPNMTITDEQFKFGETVLSYALEMKNILSKEYPGTGINIEAMLGALQYFLKVEENVERNVYMKEFKETVMKRKTKVRVPLGSDKKSDWNLFFNGVGYYYSKALKKVMSEKEIEKAASSPIEESSYCVGSSMGLDDLETVRLQKPKDSIELAIEVAKSIG